MSKMALVYDNGPSASPRRVKVVMWGRRRGMIVRFTSACSGCAPDRENVAYDRGMGCSECGYTGKRRHAEWVPLPPEKLSDALLVALNWYAIPQHERFRATAPSKKLRTELLGLELITSELATARFTSRGRKARKTAQQDRAARARSAPC